MRIKFSIDWLAYTSALILLPTPNLYAVYPPQHSTFVGTTAHNGYKTAWRNAQGVLVQWNDDRPEMRVLSQYSGTTLTRMIDDGISPTSIMQLHAIKNDARLTRIDLAFDLYDTGFSITDRYNELRSGSAKSATTKANLIVGVDGGTTLYVGSRQSDKFLRIYDKAAEMQVPGDWIRVEIEIKGDTARELGKQLVNVPEYAIAKVGKALLWNMVQFPSEVWSHLCAEQSPVDFSISHKKSDNLLGWLADQVAPAIGNYIMRGGDKSVIDQLDVMVWAYINRKSRL